MYSTKNRMLRVFGIFYVFEEKKNAKNHKFSKLVIYLSKYSSRSRAMLNTILENLGIFMFDPLPVSMQNMPSICHLLFRKSITQYSCFINFFSKLQYVVSRSKKSSQGTISWFETNFFRKKKIQPPKPWLRLTVNDVIHKQRLHQLWNHCRFLLLFSILYHLFNTIQRNFNIDNVYSIDYIDGIVRFFFE